VTTVFCSNACQVGFMAVGVSLCGMATGFAAHAMWFYHPVAFTDMYKLHLIMDELTPTERRSDQYELAILSLLQLCATLGYTCSVVAFLCSPLDFHERDGYILPFADYLPVFLAIDSFIVIRFD